MDENRIFVTDEMKAMIGQEAVFRGVDEIGKGAIKKFALAVGDLNPLYIDEEYAKKSRYGGIIAPPTFVFDVVHDKKTKIGEDGRGLARIRLPPPFGRILRGGNEYEFLKPVRPEDIISSRRKIIDIYEKQGRSGKLIFVISETTYTNQRKEVLGINRETLIFLRE